MTMLIHFFCLCPLGLAIKLNFNISKVAYWAAIISAHNTDNRADINVPKALSYKMSGNLFLNKELRIKLVNFIVDHT